MSMTTETAAPVLISNTLEWRRTRAKDLSESQRRRVSQRQVHAPLELRDETTRRRADTGEEVRTRTLRSYASLFDESYTIGSAGLRYEESVTEGAFKRSLGQSPDVVFRYDHSGPPLARTSSGSLRLGEDSTGLWYEADLNLDDPDVQALLPKIQRGDLSESSFAFRCVKDSWNEDFTTRSLQECSLDRGDVSVVTFGASRATGKHMLLRSEEAVRALQEFGAERFLEAWVEWRDYTLLTAEERAGKKLSSETQQVLGQVLELLSDADDAVDEAQPLLADLLGVPNPDSEPGEKGSSEDLTSAEQMAHLGRSGDVWRSIGELADRMGWKLQRGESLQVEEAESQDDGNQNDAWAAMARLAEQVGWTVRQDEDGTVHVEERQKSPLPADLARTTPHLLDTVLVDLSHAQQHAQRLFDSDVVKNADGQQFNAEHLKKHLDSAQNHAHKLDGHLSSHASDPEVHRAERKLLTTQRKDEREAENRDDPTDADYGVMNRLKDAKMALAYAKACQLADPDNKTDPDDAIVMGHLEEAEAAIDQAIGAQSKDGRYDDEGSRAEEEAKSVENPNAPSGTVHGPGGSVKYEDLLKDEDDLGGATEECDSCGGTGKIGATVDNAGTPCSACDGRGYRSEEDPKVDLVANDSEDLSYELSLLELDRTV